MIRSVFAFALLLWVSVSYSQTPTWQNQIACIVYSHCTECHNPSGLAPFSLTSYSDVYDNRFSISNAVSAKTMPPYLPDKSYSRFAHEKGLSQDEITLINAWVAGGAPSGDTTLAPPAPVYNSSEAITNPDLVGRIPTFTVPAIGSDLYQAFIITNPSPNTQYIEQMEVVPGNRNIVHHVLVFQDTTNAPVANDSAYAGPGYVSFGGIGSSKAQLISAWVPGSNVYTLPAGMGIRLPAGARVVVQIHYPLGSSGQVDSTKINFKFSPSPLRNVSISPVLNIGNMTNGPFVIPANSVKTFHSQYTVPANVTVVSVAPHGHLICTKFEVFGVTPANDTIRFIRINDWDFHWQGAHNFQKPIKVPAGTVLHGTAVYDNTPNNPHHPNPANPQIVTQGEATNDEMMLIYFGYLLYQNGDENIIVDTASHPAHYLNCKAEDISSGIESVLGGSSYLLLYPNPTENNLRVVVEANLIENMTLDVFDVNGKVVWSDVMQSNTIEIPASMFANGIYTVKAGNMTKRFIKQ